jgi:hypothetical protein
MTETKYRLLRMLDRFLAMQMKPQADVQDSESDQRRPGDAPIERIAAETHKLTPGKLIRVAEIPVGWPGEEFDIDTLGYKVQYVNYLTKREKEGTRLSDPVGSACAAPDGLYVFESISEKSELTFATESLKTLFRVIEHGKIKGESINVDFQDRRFQMREYLGVNSPNNILFIADKRGPTPPTFHGCIQSLHDYDTALGEFVLKHARFCLNIMDVDEEALNLCQLQLIHYNPRGGILAHIDSVSVFGDTIGPIFTVNMDTDAKAFDLLPTLLPVETHPHAVRLVTSHGQVTMMDGQSRLLWSHSIPSGNRNHCYTVAFKFPCMERYKNDTSGGFSNVLETQIPQNLKEELRQ